MVCKRGEGEVDPTKKKSSHDGKETLKISGQDIPRSRYFSLLTLQNKIKWLHLQIAPTYPGPMVEHCGLTVSCQVGVIAASFTIIWSANPESTRHWCLPGVTMGGGNLLVWFSRKMCVCAHFLMFKCFKINVLCVFNVYTHSHVHNAKIN